MSTAPWFKPAMPSPCCGVRLHKSGIQHGEQRYRCAGCGARHIHRNLFREATATGKTVKPRTMPEFKPLNRDPDAHRKLAMVTR